MRPNIRGTNREIRGQQIMSAHYAESERQNTQEGSAQPTGKNAMDAAGWAAVQESALERKDEKVIEPRDMGAAKRIMHDATTEMQES